MTAFGEDMVGHDPAGAPPAVASPPVVPDLVNSQQVAYKATYAPALLESRTMQAGRVLEKAALIRRLGLTPQEAAALRGGAPAAGAGGPALSRRTLDLVARVTAAPWPSALRLHGRELASAPHRELAAIGHAVAALREAIAGAALSSPAERGSAADLAGQTRRLVTAFALSTVPLPVGALHLERMG